MAGDTTWLAPALVLGLAAVHALGSMPFGARARSGAAGGSVAYIFLHLMPEIAASHEGRRLDMLFFALALAGLVGFYGLEHAVRRHEEQRRGAAVLRLHVASFAVYSATIGYLMMHREGEGPAGLLLYSGAMALHFLASDSSLRIRQRAAPAARTRWVLAAAVLMGGAVGLVVEAPRAWVDGLFAFVAGGMVLNVLKEELPENGASHFGAFALGAALYGALLVALD